MVTLIQEQLIAKRTQGFAKNTCNRPSEEECQAVDACLKAKGANTPLRRKSGGSFTPKV